MAVLTLRAAGHRLQQPALDKAALIARADKEEASPWPGVRPVPAPQDLTPRCAWLTSRPPISW
ncbi:hypothetical protein [Nonomuraea solani]|uniref:hypothetical protein n=1 Tax=Nonomuraea solani TaxID=1144553 RepID=UPI0011AFF535|nr:hypothetical protein [Nonomuraea solani]